MPDGGILLAIVDAVFGVWTDRAGLTNKGCACFPECNNRIFWRRNSFHSEVDKMCGKKVMRTIAILPHAYSGFRWQYLLHGAAATCDELLSQGSIGFMAPRLPA
jgi:hypothetical protein